MTLAGMAVKNIRRNPLRNVLTVMGVAIAILSFVLLRTTLDAWYSAADYAAKDRLATMHKITFVMPLPRRYFDEFDGSKGEKIPGVENSTFSTWFGGKHPTRETEFFANLAVHSPTFFDVYDDMALPPEQIEAWKQNRTGAIIGKALSKQFGWKVGDEITLVGTIYPGDWKFQIEGVYEAKKRSIDNAQFVFHWDYLNDSLPEDRRDMIGWIQTRIEDPSQSTAVAQAIDERFAEGEVQTRSMTEGALNAEFIGSAAAMIDALDIVSIVILVIMMLILGNTIAMGVRERTHEYGVLLAVGFRPKHIAGFVLGEGITIGLLGAGVGLLISYPFVEQGLGRFLEENMGAWFPYFRIPTYVALWSLALGALLAAIAAVIPAWRAARQDVVQALRRIG